MEEQPIELELEQQELKAAEAREARRRRILENSNKRLGKITGREHNEGEFYFHSNFVSTP